MATGLSTREEAGLLRRLRPSTKELGSVSDAPALGRCVPFPGWRSDDPRVRPPLLPAPGVQQAAGDRPGLQAEVTPQKGPALSAQGY